MLRLKINQEEFVDQEAADIFVDTITDILSINTEIDLVQVLENDEGDIILELVLEKDVTVHSIPYTFWSEVPILFSYPEGYFTYSLVDYNWNEFFWGNFPDPWEDDEDDQPAAQDYARGTGPVVQLPTFNYPSFPRDPKPLYLN